jgi:hypothetical protein
MIPANEVLTSGFTGGDMGATGAGTSGMLTGGAAGISRGASGSFCTGISFGGSTFGTTTVFGSTTGAAITAPPPESEVAPRHSR